MSLIAKILVEGRIKIREGYIVLAETPLRECGAKWRRFYHTSPSFLCVPFEYV